MSTKVYYLNITKHTADVSFLENATYQIGYRDGVYVLNDRTGADEICVSRPNDFVEKIREMGGDCEIITVDVDEHKFLKCIRAPEDADTKFNFGEYYAFYHDRLDMENPEPFKDIFSGLEFTRDEVDDSFVKGIDAVDTIRRFIRAAHEGATPEFRLVSYKEYREAVAPVKAAFEQKKYEPYKITNAERAVIFEGITNLCNRFDHSWTEHGVNQVIDEWERNKGELISTFMAHPNYNGNFQIVLSNEFYQLDTSRYAGRDLTNWIADNFRSSVLLEERKILGKSLEEWKRERRYLNAIMPKVTPIMSGNEIVFMNYDLFAEIRQKMDRMAFVIDMFQGERYTDESIEKKDHYEYMFRRIREYAKDRVDEEFARIINERAPEVRARAEQKTTKVVQKLMKKYGMDKIEGFHKAFAAYSDAINVIKITRHTVLSLLPMDYLTMSFGNSWSSCHTIDKENIRDMPGDTFEGMHCSGTMSYMLDGSSIVLYTVDKNYEGNTFWENNKIDRCMFHVGKEKILQGRCYPQCKDGDGELYTQFRNLVQKIMSELWEIPNQWILKRHGNYNYMIESTGTHYPDYYHFSDPNMSVFKYSALEHETQKVKIGHYPICPACGREHDTHGYLACCDGVTCPECGEPINSDEEIFEYNGATYHMECGFWCDYHDQYEPDSERYGHIANYGEICNEAAESSEFVECERCHELIWIEEAYGTYDGNVCSYCCDNYYEWVSRENTYCPADEIAECNFCGEAFYVNGATNIVEYEDGWVCEHCAEEHNIEIGE